MMCKMRSFAFNKKKNKAVFQLFLKTSYDITCKFCSTKVHVKNIPAGFFQLPLKSLLLLARMGSSGFKVTTFGCFCSASNPAENTEKECKVWDKWH